MPKADDFDEFYATTSRRLVGQLFAMTGDLVEAEDAVQGAYIRAWQRWPRIQGYTDREASRRLHRQRGRIGLLIRGSISLRVSAALTAPAAVRRHGGTSNRHSGSSKKSCVITDVGIRVQVHGGSMTGI
jgi:hypothetical protein